MPKTPPSCLSHRVFDTFAQIPPDQWAHIVPAGDLAMDLRLIGVIERSLAAQFQFWHVLIDDQQGAPAAAAALCLFRIDLLESAPAWLRKPAALVRKLFPRFMKIGVLFCGLPIPPGQSGLRLARGADPAAVVQTLHGAMKKIARRHHAALLVFKELSDQQKQQLDILNGLGYLRGDIPPMHQFHPRFADFAAYQNALKSRYRNQIKRSIRKFQEAGFTARRLQGAHEILAAYTDDLHALYVQVWQHSRFRLELLPADFFRSLARAFPDDVALTLLEKGGKIAAFTFSLNVSGVYHNLYSGMDYDLNAVGDLYFNLFYNDLDGAFQSGAPLIELGQTSDDFKSRLGSIPHPLHFFTRARNPLLNSFLRLLASRIFPAVPPVEPNLVFHEEPPPAHSARRSRPEAVAVPPVS